MARFNSVAQTITATGAVSFGSPAGGVFTTLTGTAPYSVTLASPVLFTGQSQTFHNITGGTVNLATPVGNIIGPSTSEGTTFAIPNGAIVTVTSNGTHYVLTDNEGGILTATAGTFSGTLTANNTVNFNPSNASISISPTGSGTLTVNPATTGTINNINIGGTTRGSGAFTTLAANGITSLTAGTNSSSTTDGTLVVTGGIGVSQDVRVGGTTFSALTGNVTGNITSSGTSQFSGTTTITGTFTYGGNTVVTTGTRPALGTNAIIRTNATTIAESITIPAGTNGMTAGPVTIGSGYTVTVNGDWSIV